MEAHDQGRGEKPRLPLSLITLFALFSLNREQAHPRFIYSPYVKQNCETLNKTGSDMMWRWIAVLSLIHI
jgi:hypothetical protein